METMILFLLFSLCLLFVGFFVGIILGIFVSAIGFTIVLRRNGLIQDGKVLDLNLDRNPRK